MKKIRGGLAKDEIKEEWGHCKDSGFTVRRKTIGGFERRCDMV